MTTYRAAVIGCSRMGGFIDNESAGRAPIQVPMSHGGGFFECPRTDLVACSDLRQDVMGAFGKRYDVPEGSQYTDYRQMLEQEHLDIVSVATQPEPRARIVIDAIERGVRAIYAEKPMAASLVEADELVTAVERQKVVFNLGTNRRWDARYERMKRLIDDGELGPLRTLIAYDGGFLFNMGSHMFDLLMYLNNDKLPVWVQGHLHDGADQIEGNSLRGDPSGQGMIQFENGVMAHEVYCPHRFDFEAIGDRGRITAFDNALEWQLHVMDAADRRKSKVPAPITFSPDECRSTTLRLIEDLVHALDTGRPTRGGVQAARRTMELSFGVIESHRRGGARVIVPLENRTLCLRRDRQPNQPRIHA